LRLPDQQRLGPQHPPIGKSRGHPDRLPADKGSRIQGPKQARALEIGPDHGGDLGADLIGGGIKALETGHSDGHGIEEALFNARPHLGRRCGGEAKDQSQRKA